MDRGIEEELTYSSTSIKKFSASSEDDATIAQTVNPTKRFLLDHGSSELHKFQFKLEGKKVQRPEFPKPLYIIGQL